MYRKKERRERGGRKEGGKCKKRVPWYVQHVSLSVDTFISRRPGKMKRSSRATAKTPSVLLATAGSKEALQILLELEAYTHDSLEETLIAFQFLYNEYSVVVVGSSDTKRVSLHSPLDKSYQTLSSRRTLMSGGAALVPSPPRPHPRPALHVGFRTFHFHLSFHFIDSTTS